jgi:hypothetical protein
MVEIVCQPLMPGYLLLVDADGLRHVVRVSAIQLLSDGDQCRDTTIAIIAGRALTIPLPLDDFLGQLEYAQRQPPKRPS